MVKSAVFQGQTLLGEVKVTLNPQMPYLGRWLREIRVTDFSPPSIRCPPLAVFLTIAGEVLFRMESLSPSSDNSPLSAMHAACLRELKTAVVPLGGEEIHLVAMPSKKQPIQYSCFWGFSVVPRLYTSCLSMLNLRCLGIVFDLNETLIVANTMRSFEDRIDALRRKINTQMDHEQIISILSEVKRYQDDKAILKQYVENDQVIENGKVYVIQLEIVPPLSDSLQIRDTSVLVRLRPGWDDLRSYLTAKGRKRFQAYVCTMAERDYALEMWRLLDPESNLINQRELLDRIVCVKSGSRKSLLDVFKDGVCHPSMGLVIDDRLNVWDENDQPRVHVVPAFVPYHAPSAEDSNYNVQAISSLVNCHEQRIISSYEHVMTSPRAIPFQASQMTMPGNNQYLQHSALGKSFVKSMLSEPISQGSGIAEEGEVPESEMDPNTRRRLLILQHGQDTSESLLNHRYHL
ncbi:hypothetical protein J5N97_016394 [Dioscorea zingiberensis]|uniref:protein-serine/threonine phosphatase n=1 Tax=Dioscorea zingiberensis TaxID=325984 RepID=A0A9D5CK78_9LILI|nr:hypothetical protein J5N97_016394 [Dioscorea zingiberensis]